MGIEDILMYDESLFQDINAFDPDYFPPSFNFRDTQMEAMAMAIRPAMKGGQPSNATIMGSPATGKTTAMKKYLNLLKETLREWYVFISTVSFILHVSVSFHKYTRKFSDILLLKPECRFQEFMTKS